MANVSTWSTTAANNNATPPDGWPENQAPSTVNDCAREMMASLRTQLQQGEWFDWGDSVSRASATTFKVATDVTSRYQINRRLKLNDTATLYGTIVTSAYSAPDTTIGLALDSGSLTGSLTAVGLSILSPQNTAIPASVETQGDNLLINGDFVVAQRGTAFTAATTPKNDDDTYLLDRWVLLSDGNDVLDVSQDTTTADLPTGSRAACKLLVATANLKAALLQIIENKNAIPAIGSVASLSFKARMKTAGNTTLDKLRAAIISWDSTADTVTSDVVQAWGAEGVNPTLVTNWTYESTPADLTITTAWQTFQIESVAIDTANTKNIAAFIWVDNTDPTAGDEVYITDVHVNVGAVSGEFEAKNITEELLDCQRYYEKSYSWAVAPGTSTTSGVKNILAPAMSDGSTTACHPKRISQEYKVTKRTAAPTLLFWTPTGTADNISVGVVSAVNAVISAAADKPITGGTAQWTVASTGDSGFMYATNASTTLIYTVGSSNITYEGFMQFHYTAESEL